MSVRTLSKIARARPAAYAGFLIGCAVTGVKKIGVLGDGAWWKVELMDCGRCDP